MRFVTVFAIYGLVWQKQLRQIARHCSRNEQHQLLWLEVAMSGFNMRDAPSVALVGVHALGTGLSKQITQLLHRWQQGDMDAREHLFEALYSDLMLIARNRLSQQTSGTLQPAALVNESLMRLLGTDADYKDRAHFIAIAALKMRSVLVDHLRARGADKRGGNAEQLTLSYADQVQDDSAVGYDALALHQALNQLAELEPRAASTIELTYFGGMSRDEIALVLDVSAPTVDRDLRFARAWLNRQLR